MPVGPNVARQHPDATGTARDLLVVAVDAALAAIETIASLRADDLSVSTKSTPTDLVTALDRASEATIGAHIRTMRPGDALTGEEGLSADGESGIRWLVDPLDGTVNAVYGQPAWGVSIAATDGEGAIAGVVAAPVLREVFTAVRGGGAVAWTLTEEGLALPTPLRASGESSLEMALLATGFAYDRARRMRHAALVARLLSQVRDIRRLGAAALDLCFVAAGRVDAYVEEALMPWDLAAGRLIAEEAGARVDVLAIDGPGVGLVVASAPGIHDDLLRAVAAGR